jgi:hypothetical protein
MMRRLSLESFLRTVVSVALLFGSSVVTAQGVTTSALTGNRQRHERCRARGATVIAVHVPSGTQYRAQVTSSGRYNLPNLRVGGPYRVTATSIGYEPRSEPDVFLTSDKPPESILR